MKVGTNKGKENSSQMNPIEVEELLFTVLNQLPIYQLYCENGVYSVNKLWNKAANQLKYYYKEPFKKIIADCVHSPVHVFDILTNQSMRDRLNLNQILSLCGCHPDFTDYLFKNEFFISKLDGFKLACLGQNSHNIAKYILTNDTLKGRLDGEDLAMLGMNSLEVAKIILTDKALKAKLSNYDGYNVAKLGMNLPDIAKLILEDEELKNTLNEVSIAILSGKPPENVKDILRQKVFNNNLSEAELKKIVGDFPDNAKRILERISLEARMKIINLASQNFSKIAKLILVDEALNSKLCGNDLAILGENLPEIAKLILADEKLKIKLDGCNLATLGMTSPEVAKVILNDKTLQAKLDDYNLTTLGKNYPAIAKLILNTAPHLKLSCLADPPKTDIEIVNFIVNELQHYNLFLTKENANENLSMVNAVSRLNLKNCL